MKISPFTPLNFETSNSDGLPSRYVQVFSTTDQIMIQVTASLLDIYPTATLNDAHTGDVIESLSWQSWQMNSEKKIFFTILQGLSVGHYTITIVDGAGGTLNATSDEFRVTEDEMILAKTTLIQYRNKDNKSRDDVVFVMDNVPYFFDFRVPGGFKDSGWLLGVDNEQFSTQYQDVVELYAYDYTIKNFTLGGALGVPVWFGEMLNRLLTCHFVYFNAERFSRNETETPQMNILVDGLDSFVFTQSLRRVVRIEAEYESLNQVAIRRVSATLNRIDNTEDSNVITLEI